MSVKGKEYTLLIKIAGAIDKSFGTSLATASTSLKTSLNNLDADFTKLDKGFNAITKTGKKCFKAIATAAGVAAAAIGGVTAASILVGSSFESAFTGVKKTVDATEKEYARLRQDIIDMSTEIPSSADEIAQTMEIAGQLGIATEDLTEFTKTMINLGVSTNLSAEDAATALARLANITGMAGFDEQGVSNWNRLGATIVDLGNNFATTEAEIVAMSTRLASTGSIIGLTESQILGLSTAMSSVGIRTEAGGSTMSKMLKKLQTAVEKNGTALNDYAKVANMTSDEFSALFKENAPEALLAFLKGLNDVERNGKSAVMVLEDLGIKEIRLSNTILALANSTDVFEEALKTADAAWEESTALAVEAEKRYATLESKVSLLGNSAKEAGIAIYDELRGPLADAVDFITNKIQGATDYIKSSSGIQKWLENISSTLPTVQRKVKKYGGAILDFFQPLIDIGKWFLKNPKVIVSALAGIGGALATYKIASETTHIVNSIVNFVSAASPATFAIMGVVTALGALAAAYTAYKISEREAIDNNLAEHFGNIVLSMEDLQRVAEYIVSDDSLGGVKKALDAFSNLDTFTSTMNDTILELDKMNWKVSIGMELTPDEQESYKAAIAEYVATAQDYALQAQYAVSLNIVMAFDENSNVVSKVNKFYADKTAELAELGTSLNEAVTNAFNDGLLEIDELQVITGLQQQMAEIKKQMALGEVDAAMSLLGMQYSGANLSAESFQNLQAELDTQTQAAIDAYRESYKQNFAAVSATYNAGYLTEAEYNASIAQLQSTLQSEIASVQTRAIEFMLNTISETYSDELSNYDDAIKKALEYGSDETYSAFGFWSDNATSMWDSVIAKMFEYGADETSQKAVEELLGGMNSAIDTAYSLLDSWDMLNPETQSKLTSVLNTLERLQGYTARRDGFFGGLAGDTGALSNVLARAVLEGGNGYGQMYDWVSTYYTDMTGRIKNESEGIWKYTQEYMQQQFSTGITVQSDLKINLDPVLRPNRLPSFTELNFGKYGGIDHNATGGLIRNKELSWLGENGPEMVVPLDGSSRALSLWQQAGQLLGTSGRFSNLDLSGGTEANITYSPTLQFYGDAPSKNDLTDALRVSQDEFDAMMENYFKRQHRMSFA